MSEHDPNDGADEGSGDTDESGGRETDPTPTAGDAPATGVGGSPAPGGWRVLVPVRVLEGEDVPESVAALLSPLPAVLLGYHVLPEQTAPGQARLQFEDRAQAKVDEMAALFEAAGTDVETRLVFTQDAEESVDRVAEETGCAAVLHPNPAGDVRRLLVPLGGEVDVGRVVGFVAALVDGREIDVTLLHVAGGEEAAAAGRGILDGAAEQLHDAGITAETRVIDSATPVDAIATAAVDHDAVVMGESEPSLRSFLFGETAEQVAQQSVGPVIAVRRAAETDVERET